MTGRFARMTDDELRAFVLGVCDGRIFTSSDVPGYLLGSVFMPIVLGAFAGWSEDDVQQVGLLWEYLHEAGPLSVNGMPTFFSCRVMHCDDLDRALVAIDAEHERSKRIEQPPPKAEP